MDKVLSNEYLLDHISKFIPLDRGRKKITKKHYFGIETSLV